MPIYAGDTVLLAATQTLTNKTIDGGSNTITNVGTTSLASEAVALRRNFAKNASFDHWFAGTSFAIPSGAQTFSAVRWKGLRGATGSTHTRQTGYAGATYCYRAQRDSGNSATQAVQFGQQLESIEARLLAGQTVRLSADIRCGADYSAGSSSISASIRTGTGIDEPISAANAFPTGAVSSGTLTASATLTTTTARIVFGVYTIPSTATELFFNFFYTPVGTAGAADYFEVTNVKLEIASTATAFKPDTPTLVLAECLRHFERIGGNIAATRFATGYADSTTHGLFTLRYSRKRATPTITVNGTVGTDFDLKRTGAASVAPTAIAATASSMDADSCEIDVTVAAGLTAGEGLGFRAATTTGTIDIDARL